MFYHEPCLLFFVLTAFVCRVFFTGLNRKRDASLRPPPLRCPPPRTGCRRTLAVVVRCVGLQGTRGRNNPLFFSINEFCSHSRRSRSRSRTSRPSGPRCRPRPRRPTMPSSSRSSRVTGRSSRSTRRRRRSSSHTAATPSPRATPPRSSLARPSSSASALPLLSSPERSARRPPSP